MSKEIGIIMDRKREIKNKNKKLKRKGVDVKVKSKKVKGVGKFDIVLSKMYINGRMIKGSE
jgi:hypothetical protein